MFVKTRWGNYDPKETNAHELRIPLHHTQPLSTAQRAWLRSQSWKMWVLTGITPSLLIAGALGISQPLWSHIENPRLSLKSAEMETKALFVPLYDQYEYIWFVCNNDTNFIPSHALGFPPYSAFSEIN